MISRETNMKNIHNWKANKKSYILKESTRQPSEIMKKNFRERFLKLKTFPDINQCAVENPCTLNEFYFIIKMVIFFSVSA